MGPDGSVGEFVPYKDRPCVELCYLRSSGMYNTCVVNYVLRKLANLPPLTGPNPNRKPCVGMCYRKRRRGKEVRNNLKAGHIENHLLGSVEAAKERSPEETCRGEAVCGDVLHQET